MASTIKRDVKKIHYNQGILLTEQKKKEILEKAFKERVGYDLNFENPQTFNEKIMWSKLYYQDPLITKCSDKFAVKEYVTEKIGAEHIVPTIAWWEDPEDIDFDQLPDSFVLKVNWSSGYNIIVKDKSTIDESEIKDQLKRWMKPDRNAYYQYFNWGFKHQKAVVYAEEYIEQVDGQVYDYKFFTFGGEVKALFIATDRHGEDSLTYNYFDREFNFMPFYYGRKDHAYPLPDKPKHFEEMIELAEILAKPFPFVRVDFYEIGDRILLGEMTFYSGGGLLPFDPIEWDYKFGEWYKLPEKRIIDKDSLGVKIRRPFVRAWRGFRQGCKKFRSVFIKHEVINKNHYIILFRRLRIPLSMQGNFIRMEGIEIRKPSWIQKRALISKAKEPFKFQFMSLEPHLCYMIEDKLTIDMKKHYCEQKAYKQLKYFPNLDEPKTFNEKLLWLALYYKNPVMKIGADKAIAKDFIAGRVGSEYTVPSIGIYDNVNDIDFDSLPSKFVMKANNGWGGNDVLIVRDKNECNIDKLKAISSTWLYPWSYYYYANMCITDEKIEKPYIVIEQLLEQKEKKYLDDYKLYCCNGKVKFSLIINDRGSKDQNRTFVDADWNVLNVRRLRKPSNPDVKKPQTYEKMVELAEKLACDVPFARVDFYDIDGKVYVGEITYTPGLFLSFEPKNADRLLGDYLDLTEVMKAYGPKH